MSRHSITLEQIASWDLVVTTSGVIILVVPHGTHCDIAIAADDGIVLKGKRSVHLMESGRIVPYVRRNIRLLLVQAGSGRHAESVVPVVIHNGSIHARRHHGESAAA